MKRLKVIGLLGFLCLAIPLASAQSEVALLSSCLVDNLDGKERKGLSKWIFLSISVHPEIEKFTSIGPESFEETDRYIGSLIDRLLTEDCPNELIAAIKADPMALQKAFEMVGQVAVQELMTNDQVMTRLTNYARYVDMEKLSKIVGDE